MNNWGKERNEQTDHIKPITWNKHFKSLLNNNIKPLTETKLNDTRDMDNPGRPLWNFDTFDPILDSRITVHEIREGLRMLKNRKAPGPDGILVEYIKVFGEAFEDILLKILRGLFAQYLYPPQWNLNYLKPIYKKGDVENPGNYRGLALASTLSKLFSLILLQRLLEYIELNKLITPKQIGFMKGSRTSDHIFLLQTIVEKVVKQGKGKLYTAFIDFKKAYDTVNRKLLLQRLKSLGINGIFFHNIAAMYENTQYLIKIKDGFLDPISNNLGLRRGCPLSPMLFNIFIDDIDIFDDSCHPITMQNEKINHFLYADDLVLVSDSPEGLQNALDKVGKYAKDKQLNISIDKSKTMVFNQPGKYIKKEFNINSETLESVQKFCYLGFDVKPSGTVKHAMNILNDKAKKALRPLSCAIARFNISVKTAIKLFHTYISPIILYNVENWATMTDKGLKTFTESDLFDNTDRNKTDILHRKFLKYILGVSKSCPNMALYGDTGEIPLSIKGYRLMIDYWKRLNTLPESNLAKIALMENINIRTSWIMTIENLLKAFNLTETTGGEPEFKRASKQYWINYYKSRWHIKIESENMSRLSFFQKINNGFEPSKYTEVPHFKLRKIIAKIRCSDHFLEVEKGRHRKVPRDERLCKMCSDKAIEDEEHFLIVCKKYEHLRKEYEITSENVVELMNIENQQHLAKYIIRAMEVRNTTLELNKKE